MREPYHNGADEATDFRRYTRLGSHNFVVRCLCLQSVVHTAPTRVEKYEVREEIGHGGMATVYRAEDVRLGRDVALKILHPHLRGTEQARVRFHREAQSVAKLKHPNILEIYDYSGLDSDLSYIATELLTGPTLKKLVDEIGALPPEVAVAICVRLCEALTAAHTLGVVHRDVKPENVLVHENRTVKLADFGIADMVDAHSVTATGQILGSPGHMAPEQIEGKDADARADIFSLGTVLYVLLTGEQPFAGRNVHAILHRVLENQYTDPERLCPQMGKSLRRILVRAMARDPNDRYPSAVDFAAALEHWLSVQQAQPINDLISGMLRTRGDFDARRTFVASLRDRAYDTSLRLGRDAIGKQDVENALDHLGRALALRPDAKEPADLLRRVGQRQKRHRTMWALALSATLIVPAIWWVRARPPNTAAPTTASARPEKAPVTRPVAANTNPSPTAITPTEVLSDQRSIAVALSKALRPRLQQPLATREVVFDFDPVNVSISVDGSSPRPFGPSFDRMQLSIGEHQFSVSSNVECCVDTTFRTNIPDGNGAFRIRRTLTSRPALLIVRSNVAGDVRMDGRTVGRTRSPIEIPLGEVRSLRSHLEVHADGYENGELDVELHANEVETVVVDLRLENAASATPPD